jgi:hypothetical protein
MDIARAARLVDAKGNWAGDAAVLVQLGDVVDRGPDSLKIIQHLMQLQRQAPHAGGKVIVLIGNHEAMNATGDLRYVDPGEYRAFVDRQSERRRKSFFEANRVAIEAAFRERDPRMSSAQIRTAWMEATPPGKIEHQLAWRPRGKLGRWAASNPAVAKVGDTLFVHGGLSSDYASQSIDEINRAVEKALEAVATEPDAIINDPRGPLWYRGLILRGPGDETSAQPPASEAASSLTMEEELELVLRAFGAARMVVGHTPQVKGIELLHGGRLARIDTGISRGYGGTPSYLEIKGGEMVPHRVERTQQ